jgi:hypothetical protein
MDEDGERFELLIEWRNLRALPLWSWLLWSLKGVCFGVDGVVGDEVDVSETLSAIPVVLSGDIDDDADGEEAEAMTGIDRAFRTVV